MIKIIGVLLAAGKSSRMGRNKLFLPYKNHTVIEEVLHQLSYSQLEKIMVITGFEKTRIEDLLSAIHAHKFQAVHNKNYASGRTESIKCAIHSLKGLTDAALFMVADKPTVRSDLIDRAIEKFKTEGAGILYVKTPKGRGHPIIFSKELFEEMMTLSEENPLEDFIKKHQNEAFELKDSAVQININTQEDYEKLLES